jgi:hypothetical protein
MMEQAADAARLLQEFGTGAAMVKKIDIDLDKTCSQRCLIHDISSRHEDKTHGVHFALQMRKLLARITRRPDLQVDFVHPKGKAHHDFHAGDDLTQMETGIHLDKLNTTLRTLRRDRLKIRKSGRQVSEIYVQRDCSEGRVFFEGPDFHKEGMPKLCSSIWDEGKVFSWIKDEIEKPSLLNLPEWMKERILNLANLTWDPYTSESNRPAVSWDLDKKTVSGASPVVGAICKEFRSNYAHEFWDDNYQLFNMITTDTRTDFDQFRKLERFWNAHDRMQYTCSERYHSYLGKDPIVRFLLNFDLDSWTTLESIRINITSLLRITAEVKQSSKITISLTGTKGKSPLQSIMSLRKCRKLALASLSKAFEEFDEFSECDQEREYPAV